jgi:hypothetical protein
MKIVALTLVSIVIFDVSYGLKCKEDSACLTLAGMGGGGWGGYFQDQANAPCLAGLFGGSDVVSCTFEEETSLNIYNLVQVFWFEEKHILVHSLITFLFSIFFSVLLYQ